jgi:hypothetical protein
MRYLALVGTQRYFADNDGRLFVTKGLKLVMKDPSQEVKLLRRFARMNDTLAKEFPCRSLPLTLAHQQRQAALLIEKAILLQPSA